MSIQRVDRAVTVTAAAPRADSAEAQTPLAFLRTFAARSEMRCVSNVVVANAQQQQQHMITAVQPVSVGGASRVGR